MHPGLHVQVKLPTVSVQIALAPQGLVKHPSTSVISNKNLFLIDSFKQLSLIDTRYFLKWFHRMYFFYME